MCCLATVVVWKKKTLFITPYFILVKSPYFRWLNQKLKAFHDLIDYQKTGSICFTHKNLIRVKIRWQTNSEFVCPVKRQAAMTLLTQRVTTEKITPHYVCWNLYFVSFCTYVITVQTFDLTLHTNAFVSWFVCRCFYFYFYVCLWKTLFISLNRRKKNQFHYLIRYIIDL